MSDKLSAAHRDPIMAGGQLWGPTSGVDTESRELQTRLTAENPASGTGGRRADTDIVSRSATDDLADVLRSRSGRPDSSSLTASGVRPEDVLPVVKGGAPVELLPESRGETMRAHVERMEPKDPMGLPRRGEDDLDSMRKAADSFDQKKERTLYSGEQRGMLQRVGESIEKGGTASTFKSLGESMAHGGLADTEGGLGASLKRAGEKANELLGSGLQTVMAPILTSQADSPSRPRVEMSDEMARSLTEEEAINRAPDKLFVHQA